MTDNGTNEVLQFIANNPSSSSREIHEGLESTMGYATVKRILVKLTLDNLIITEGKGKSY